MGLFNEVTCHYKPLGDTFYGVYLQTKDPEPLMHRYWINPSGELYQISTFGCFHFEETNPPPEGYQGWWPPYEWVPNGNHGKITPVFWTGCMRMYPGTYDGEWDDWPEVLVYFKHGKIKDYIFQQKGEQFYGNSGYDCL